MREALAPNGGKRSVGEPLKVSSGDFKAFLRRETQFFVLGFIAYTDTFGMEHRTNFAYRLELLTAPDGKDVFLPVGGAEYWEYT